MNDQLASRIIHRNKIKIYVSADYIMYIQNKPPLLVHMTKRGGLAKFGIARIDCYFIEYIFYFGPTLVQDYLFLDDFIANNKLNNINAFG